jgi:hypothetical protein
MPQVHARGIFLPPFYCHMASNTIREAEASDSRCLRVPVTPRELQGEFGEQFLDGETVMRGDGLEDTAQQRADL